RLACVAAPPAPARCPEGSRGDDRDALDRGGMSGYLTPSATTTTLRVEESVLAYNGDRIHFLTGSAAEIWAVLDGSSTEADIASVLAARHPDPAVAQETRRF